MLVTVPSHFKNETIPKVWRYGIPIYLIANVTLFLVCHIGSGFSFLYKLKVAKTGKITEADIVVTVSVFTSVQQLWQNDSKVIAIYICFASIAWPYVKLLLSLFAWVTPFKNARRRERLLVFLDALGKWSFVDVFVVFIFIVAFEPEVPIGLGSKSGIKVKPCFVCVGCCVANSYF